MARRVAPYIAPADPSAAGALASPSVAPGADA